MRLFIYLVAPTLVSAGRNLSVFISRIVRRGTGMERDGFFGLASMFEVFLRKRFPCSYVTFGPRHGVHRLVRPIDGPTEAGPIAANP